MNEPQGIGRAVMAYDLEVTLEKGTTLPVPVKEGSQFAGWQDESGKIVTEAVADGTLTATWK